MTAQLLDYTPFFIQGKLTSGSLNTLFQKNNQGAYIQHQDLAKLQLKMKAEYIIDTIQIRITNIQKLTIELLSQRQELIQVQNRITNQKQKTYLISFNKEMRKKTKTINLSFSNIHGDIMKINYIIVKGQKQKMTINKSQKKQNFFQQPKRSPCALIQKIKANKHNFFQDRTKRKYPQMPQKKQDKNNQQKNKNNQYKDKNNQQKDKNIYQKESNYDYDSQFYRVLELSRKQAQESLAQQKYQKTSKKPQLKVIQQETIKMQQIKQQQPYTLIDYNPSRFSHVFQHVTPAWLQAQKRAQQKLGVRQQHKLSNHIKVKHLRKKSIIIDLQNSQLRQKIQKSAVQMGANIIKELKQNCILVTNRVNTQIVSRAKKIKNVAIVNPFFIEDCQVCDSLLDIKNYLLK